MPHGNANPGGGKDGGLQEITGAAGSDLPAGLHQGSNSLARAQAPIPSAQPPTHGSGVEAAGRPEGQTEREGQSSDVLWGQKGGGRSIRRAPRVRPRSDIDLSPKKTGSCLNHQGVAGPRVVHGNHNLRAAGILSRKPGRVGERTREGLLNLVMRGAPATLGESAESNRRRARAPESGAA